MMNRRPVKVGLFLPGVEGAFAGGTATWRDITDVARAAEDLGFDSLWVPDHMIFEPNGLGEARLGSWDAWAWLAGLAAVTNRVEIGPLVACTSFRNPAMIAKVADTIDDMSNGRLILGLGAGWNEPEYRSFGFPFDRRVSRFEEAFTIIRTLLQDGFIDFTGTYYQARDCELRPRAARPGGPPLLLGSKGERMLRIALPYIQQWNMWATEKQSPQFDVPPVRDQIDRICQEIARDPATLLRTATLHIQVDGAVGRTPNFPGWSKNPLRGSATELADIMRAYAAEGISHIQVELDPGTVDGVRKLAEVLRELDRG